MPEIRGSEVIAEYLVKEKVPYVFGVGGHGIIQFLDALYDRQDKIKAITVRHEQAAGHIADAYFRVAHKPVATYTSCGPSSANLPVALACAMMDSSALLAITGNVPTSQFNRGPFQETGRYYQAEFANFIRPYVKRAFQPTRVDMIPLAIRQAFKTMMTGRTGPVNLDVPYDCFEERAEVEVPEPSLWRENISSRAATHSEALLRAFELLAGTEKVCIVAGHGAMLSEASPELIRLAERMKIPVATTPNGKGIVPADHPLHLGVVGRNGNYAANESSRSCDVLLALGVKFDDRQSSGWVPGYTFNIPPTKLIHVDIDPEELGKNYPPTLGLLADVKGFLQVLTKIAEARISPDEDRNRSWLNKINDWKAAWIEFTKPGFESDAVPVRPERLVGDIRKVMPKDGILAVDVGEFTNWVTMFYDVYEPRTMLQSWGFGSMGFGVCGVLGAKLAAPEKVCACVCGDGGFMMTPHILSTAVQYAIPAVWVVWNNYGYNSIRHVAEGCFPNREIASMFRKESSGEFYNPDFAALAISCGAKGAKVERPGDFIDIFREAIDSRSPYVIEVPMEQNALAPTTGSWVLPPFPHSEPAFGKRNLREKRV